MREKPKEFPLNLNRCVVCVATVVARSPMYVTRSVGLSLWHVVRRRGGSDSL